MTATSVLAHRMDGEGEPLLLLNGGMMTVSSWDGIAAQLANHYRVLRCDLRGQLLSPGPPPATFPGHVVEVVELLDHLELGEVHVVGTSFGAEVGLYLAALYPNRVRSLVAATAADHYQIEMVHAVRLLRQAARRAATAGERLRFFELMLPTTYSQAYLKRNSEALLAEVERRIAKLPVEWFLDVDALLATIETLDLTPHLAAIRCPTLVVSAELDEIMPAARSAALARGVAGAREVVVAGSGHALVVEQPERLVALTLSFLAELAVSDGGSQTTNQDPPGGSS